jgi:hypothetical protein
MLQIQNALGILSSQVPTGNLLWVDQINGVDALAARGRLTIPFRTLAAARDAATEGDTIVVLPGVYTDDDLLRDGVNWHFMNGAMVDAGAVIFDASGGGITSVVSGSGEFMSSDKVVYSSGSDITIEALNLTATSADCIQCSGATGSVHIKARGTISAPSGVAIVIDGSASGHIIEAFSISATGYGISMLDGGGYVRAHVISSGSVAVKISDGAALVIDAFEINSSATYAVSHDSADTLLTVRGARIVSDSTNAVYLGSSCGSDTVRLYGCLLISDGVAKAITAATGSTRVQLAGGTYGNNDKDTTVTVAGSSWAFDTNLV